MANYTQWLAHADKGEIKRATWVCGEARVWVEEVVDIVRDNLKVSDLDYTSLVAGEASAADIWDAMNQYPLDASSSRLILVRESEKIKKWDKLEDWLANSRLIPRVHVVFISKDPEFYPTDKYGKPIKGDKTNFPHVDLLKNKGQHIVRCKVSQEKDVIAWVQRKIPIDSKQAKFLISRASGDLWAISNACNKMRICGLTDYDEGVIARFCDEMPSESVADYIIMNKKREALKVLAEVELDEYPKIIGLLDSRLDFMTFMNKALRDKKTTIEIKTDAGSKNFLVDRFLGEAKNYDTKRVSLCRNYMAVVDDAIRNGAKEGTLEMLVSIW